MSTRRDSVAVLGTWMLAAALPVGNATASGFVLTMQATGFEDPVTVEDDSVAQIRSVQVSAGALDGYEGDASLPISINPAIETIHSISSFGAGCGWSEVKCYAQTGQQGGTIACDSPPGSVKSARLWARARCTFGCCSGYYKATATISLERHREFRGGAQPWTSDDVSGVFAVDRADIPRSPVGEEPGDAPLPLAHITDFATLGGLEGSGVPPTTTSEKIDTGSETGIRVTTTFRVVTSADYFADSDTPRVLVGAFAEPGEAGPLGFPENGSYAWATLSQLGLSLPPVVSFTVAPEKSIAPGDVKVFQHGQNICFTAHPFSFHLPLPALTLDWQSSTFPGIETAASTSPAHFCTPTLSQGEGPVELTVAEVDPRSGEVLGTSTTRQLMRVTGVPTLLAHDTWGDPRSLAELQEDLSTKTTPGDPPPLPTYTVDLSAAQAENVLVPIDVPIPPPGREGERETLFHLTPHGYIAKGTKVKVPLASLFRVDVPFDAHVDFGASWLGYALAAVAEFFIEFAVLTDPLVVAETGITSGTFKNESGQPAADFVLELLLRNFEVEYFPATPADAEEPPNHVDDYGRGPRLKFQIVLAGRIDLQAGALIEGYHKGEIPLIPNSLISGLTDAGEMVQLAVKFGLTAVHEGRDLKALQGGASVVFRTTIPMALAKAQGPVSGYVPTLAARVQEAKQDTGLDRVNIVGHGMGGLVARYYAQFVGIDVSKLVLVATPNHGADFYFAAPYFAKKFVTWAASYLAGPTMGAWIASFIGTVIDAIFGQAARDMTPHSDLLAMLNGHRGDTAQPEEHFPPTLDFAYTLSGAGLGGQATPTHFHLPNPIATQDPLYPLPNSPSFVVPGVVALCFIPGAGCNPYGDVIVPEDSVIIQNGPSVVNNDRIDARHWSIKEVLEGTATVASRLADDPPEGSSTARGFPGYSAQALGVGEFLMTPGDSQELGFDLDTGVETLLAEVLGSGEHPTVTLIDPSGVVTPVPLEEPDPGLLTGSLAVHQPAAGSWRLRASLASDATVPASVHLRAVGASRSFVAVATGKSRYNPGEDAVISMVAMSGSQLSTANEAGALVVLPSGQHRFVPCIDDGNHGDGQPADGNCVGVLPSLAEHGTYRVIGWARQESDDRGLPVLVDRRAFATFEVRRDLNLSIEGFTTSDPSPTAGDHVTLTAQVSNQGDVAQPGIPVLFAAANRAFDAHVVDLDPLGTVTASSPWEAAYGPNAVLTASICPAVGLMETRLVPAADPIEEPILEAAFDDNSVSLTSLVQAGEAPAARPRPVEARSGVRFLLDGSTSTSGVPITSYDWLIGSLQAPIASFAGKQVSIDAATIFPVDSPPAGPVPVSLTVIDAAGREHTDTSTIEVRRFDNEILAGDTEPPLADAGPDFVVLAGDAVVLDGGASSDNFGIGWAFWDLDIARAEPVADVVGLRVEIPQGFDIPGVHTARLYVNDVRGNGPAWDDIDITVLQRPVTLSLHLPSSAESGSRQRITVGVRDSAGRRIVDQGRVELTISQRPSRTWVQHVTNCGAAVFNVPLTLPPRTYDVTATFFASLTFEQATLHESDAIEVIDSRGPNVFVGNLEQGVLTAGQDFVVDVQVTDDGSLVDEVTILLDGVPIVNGETIPAEDLPPGEHVLEVTAVDSRDNSTAQQNDIVVRPHIPADFGQVFEGGLCASGDVVLSNNATISGFGAEDGIVVAGDLQLCNNAMIVGSATVGCSATIHNNATITGDLAASGAIIVGNNAAVEGETVELPCDVCEAPAVTAQCEWLDVNDLRSFAETRIGWTRQQLGPALPNGALDPQGNLRLENNAAVSIPAGIFAVRSLHLSNNVALNVSSGRAVLLVLGHLGADNNVQVGQAGGELAVIGLAPTTIVVGNNTVANVAIYAPRAELTLLANNTVIEGGITVADLRLANNSHLVLPPPRNVGDPLSWCY